MAVPAYVTEALSAAGEQITGGSILGTLRQRQTIVRDARQRLNSEAETRADRKFTADEARASAKLLDVEGALAARIDDLAAEADRSTAGATSRAQLNIPNWSVGREPGIYRGENNGPSFVKDLAARALYSDRDASERLANHTKAESRALTTTDGAGGEFVPPTWMVDKYLPLIRGGRVFADRITQQQLPGGTDSFNIPKMSTGTSVAEQTTQNTAISNTDATTTSVNLTIQTYAGMQLIAQQQLDQSPINMDEVWLKDLLADYTLKLDAALFSRATAGGVGILAAAGVNSVSYTDATPTAGELYPKIADAIQRAHIGRMLPPEAIVLHPRRWAWLLSQLDANGRPLVVPSTQQPFNGLGFQDGVSSQGYAGTCQGLPVFVDPNVPTNLGAGTNEDRILIGRWSDALLFESTPRLEAFRETKGDQLSVMLRLYNYAAWTFARYPAAFSVISGTGCIAPTF